MAEPKERTDLLPTWRECFLAALSGACADPNVTDEAGGVRFAANVADSAAILDLTFKGPERNKAKP